MLIKAGTYRFNDVLSFAPMDFVALPFISNSQNFVGIVTNGTSIDRWGVVGVINLETEELVPIYAINYGGLDGGWQGDYQTHNITQDTEVDDTFGTWYKANTDYDEVNGITITWDGQIEGREKIILSVGSDIVDYGYLLHEIGGCNTDTFIGSTFEVCANGDNSVTNVQSPILEIKDEYKVLNVNGAQICFYFGDFTGILPNNAGTIEYPAFIYAIEGEHSSNFFGENAILSVPKTGIYAVTFLSMQDDGVTPRFYPCSLTIHPETPTKTKKFTRLYLGEVAYSSNGKRFRKLQYTPPASEGLEYTSNGDGTCYVRKIGTCTDTDIVIPSVSPNGDRVTSIGKRAFLNCSSLTSITIPSSVTSIGWAAFGSCGLTSITIPDTVTSMDGGTFNNCYSLASVTIGNGLTSIGDETFLMCDALTSVTIGNGITSIGYNAFCQCEALTSITIPDSVTTIEGAAFQYCRALEVVTIGNGVTRIDSNAFYGCEALASVVIGDNATSIGSNAFYNCTSLSNITYGGTVKQWNAITLGENWVYNVPATYVQCTDGKALLNHSEGLAFTSNGDGTCSVSGRGTCTDTDIVISSVSPDGDIVTTIGRQAFMSNTSITSVIIPNSVTVIGESAFSGCTNLQSVEIPNSVTTLGAQAFYMCVALTNIVIPNSVEVISSLAFYNCLSLGNITFEGTVAQWNDIQMSGNWNDNVLATYVQCTDGQVTL